jgi:hypothetical protein
LKEIKEHCNGKVRDVDHGVVQVIGGTVLAYNTWKGEVTPIVSIEKEGKASYKLSYN